LTGGDDRLKGAADAVQNAAEAAQEAAGVAAEAVRRNWPRLVAIVALAVVLTLAALIAAMRYGVLLPQARLLIQAATNGLEVGRFGRLQVQGLSGDIWSDLSVARLTLRDEKGVWLEADDVHLKWRYLELLRRNFQADDIEVGDLKLIRRPTLRPGGEAGGLPLSFHVDRARARLDLLPDFSYVRGVYDLDFNFDVERSGAERGRVRAASVLHPGDHLNADFDLSKSRPLVLQVDAVEAQGGALAGALGLPAQQPFSLRIVAGGRTSAGRFTAVAASGSLRPLEAEGAWTPLAGQASGRISLTASSLTAPYARRFGPEAAFTLSGRKAGPSLFALQGRLAAQNLTVAASGLGDLGERKLGPQGLSLSLAAADLGRIVGAPRLGAAHVTGVLTASPGGWRYAGQAAAGPAALGAYSLARAAGPFVLTRSRGDTGLMMNLAGAGGRGAGFIATAFGGTPKAVVEGARLADGRLALRRLEITGSGLKLLASGGRSLLGGLTFKGQASLSNLAAARVGASGAAQATWSAVQARAGQPWTVSLDARGERFATGYPELDRLLGARPVLKAQANVEDKRIAVGQAVLTGANLTATTAGVLGRGDGALSFKLDWSASGPFHAGPVEIAGRARGDGAVTGSLGAPRADLVAHLESVDLPRLPLKNADLTLSFMRRPDGASGLIAATAASAYGPARGRSAFRFPQGGVDLTDLSVDAGGVRASGSLSLRRSTASAADLEVAIGKGAFLDAGRVAGHMKIADAPGGPHATLALDAQNARAPGSEILVRVARLGAEGPLARLPYALSAEGTSPQGKWGARGRGVFGEAQPGYSATFDGSGQLGGRNLRTAETAAFRFGGPERTARLRLAASDGGHIDLDARLTDQTADVRAQVADLGLQMLDEDLAGRIDATLTLNGRGGRLDGGLDARLAGARGRGAAAASGVDGTLRGRIAGGTLELTANGANAQGLKADADLVLPAAASAAPFRFALDRTRPMRGRFSARGEVRPLWDLLVGGERSLSGKVQTQGTLGGTLADPTASGQIAVDDGRFDDGQTGLSLRQVSLRAVFAREVVDVTQASGVDGRGGAVTGLGRISLERNGTSSFRLNLKGFRLIDNEFGTASASGQATIDRSADGKVRLSGNLLIDQANLNARLPNPTGVVTIDVVEKNRPADLPASIPPPQLGGQGWRLDVGLRAPGRIFLKGRGLNVEMSLDAHVGGSTSAPLLTGTAHVVRGDYDFAGKRFEFDPTSVVYLSTHARAIRLELLATRSDPSLTASIRIRGTADKPEITLTSSPALPQDEILSQVLFGRSASQLSGLEAAQVASAISSVAGGGGLDVIGNLRLFAGLDRLALGGDSQSGATISGGKYLRENVYLELTGGGRTGPSAQVEWRVKRDLSIVSKVAGQGEGNLSIRWRRDY